MTRNKSRLLGGLTAAVLLLTALPAMLFAEASAAQAQVLHNLVLFAQFDDTNGYNFMDGRTEQIQTLCNSTETDRSLRRYTELISYGQLQVDCVFPQLQDGVITPYTLTDGAGAYTDETTVVLEVLRHVSIPATLNLDGNNDGIVDNIILVVDGSASGTGDFLWPKAFSLYGVQVSDKVSGYVNIQNSHSLFEDTIAGGVGVLCHEFLHSIGYPDLYRQTDGTPVGAWDLMASASVFLQYPLAYQRSAISGWLPSSTLTADGTYTLQPAASDSGNRLYLLKTPLSDTEFFAVEYRCKGTAFSDELDVKIYGSGLVIYRINTEETGNYRSTRDGVYVFRPGETDPNAAAGDLFASCYGGTDAPDSIGTPDFQATIADGALVYSDGTNSGISIQDITLNGDSASFAVSFADTTQTQLWKTAGDTTDFSGTVSFDLAAAGNQLYLLTSDGTAAVASRLEDNHWVQQGEKISGGSFGSVNDVRLTVCAGSLYALYHDSSYAAVLCHLEADGSWKTLFQSTESAQYSDLCATDDTVYLALTTGTYPYALSLCAYDTSAQSIEFIAEAVAANTCNLSLTCTESGIPVVAFRDLSDGDVPKAAVISGGTVQILPLGTACGTVKADCLGEKILIAATGTVPQLSALVDGVVSSVALPASVDDSCFLLQPLCTAQGQFLLANTQNPPALTMYRADDNGWSVLGNVVAQEVVNEAQTVLVGDTLFVAYLSESEKLVVRKLAVPVTEPEGDVNCDGVVNVADAVLLQQALVGAAKLNAQQAQNADLRPDTCINVWDLTLLKRLLLQK